MRYAPLLLLGLVFCLTGCTGYSSVSKIRPTHRSATEAGRMITRSLKQPSTQPLVQIGGLLDAASSAAKVIAVQPGDQEAVEDYNFAVARVFEIIHSAGLEPWQTPLSCPGEETVWKFRVTHESHPSRNPSNFNIQPADVYRFKGTLVKQRTLKEGIGAPLVVVSKNTKPKDVHSFEVSRISYGVTGVLNFNGNDCTGTFIDPLSVENISFQGHTRPLAADFTAPLALALANNNQRQAELDGLFHPVEFESKARLAMLQPYDPKKIPVLCIHGLGDSQATWAPLIQTLRGDPVIRRNYQFWFFSYPTGYPYPLAASVLRHRLDAIYQRYPNHKDMVVIGHSMGGMISRTLITNSGMKLWDAIYDKPPEDMPFSSETRRVMTEALIFESRDDISRVIFASASHRGSDLASDFIGRLGSRVVGSPVDLLPQDPKILTLARPGDSGQNLRRLPNSIDFLKPDNRFVNTLAGIPTAPGIPYHSIIGDRGKGGNPGHEKPVSTDGIVPYWSSHLDGAKSELIIPSQHWTNQHPLGIAEVGRILREHLKTL